MEIKGTTIVGVKRDGHTVIAGDGQVTAGQSVIMKGNAVKVRRLYNDEVIVGFAGTVADAFMLSEKFEEMLNKYSGNLMRSAVALAQLWRGDAGFRQLEALMIVANKDEMLVLDGTATSFSQKAAFARSEAAEITLWRRHALMRNTKMNAKKIAVEAMKVARNLRLHQRSLYRRGGVKWNYPLNR
ncbi:MAG: ATP-dependent protease subunit HslV [Christensenellales bacterium]